MQSSTLLLLRSHEFDVACRSFKMVWRCVRTPDYRSSGLWQSVGDGVYGRVPASLPRVGVEVVDDLGQKLDKRVIHNLERNGIT